MYQASLVWSSLDGRVVLGLYDADGVLVGEGQGDSLGEALQDAGLDLD